jgi:hypothetical protein
VTQSFDRNLFGKIGRLTVDMDINDGGGNLQGVRLYSDPLFVTVQRNPDVTIADSFAQSMNYERLKVLKQIFYVLENPLADVVLELYVDGNLRYTVTLSKNASYYPDILIRRQDFPTGMKGKLFRFVFTSSQPFEIDWPHSHLGVHDVNTENTFRRPPLDPPKTF